VRYDQKSENIDFKGLAEVLNKLIFNNLHNPPPKKYFDMIINPLYSKQLLNLVLVEDCGGIYNFWWRIVEVVKY
jgi:hypothetical protein